MTKIETKKNGTIQGKLCGCSRPAVKFIGKVPTCEKCAAMSGRGITRDRRPKTEDNRGWKGVTRHWK